MAETGYKAEKLVPIIPTPLCPALTPTRTIHFFAPEVEFVGNGGKEFTEEIEILKFPVGRLDGFLLNLPKDTELDLRVPGILCVLDRRKLI